MFLSNYFKKQAAICKYGLNNNSSQQIQNDLCWRISKCSDSSVVGKYVVQQNYRFNSGTSSSDQYGKYSVSLTPVTFSVGSGSTPVTFNDYILDNDITSLFTNRLFSSSILVDDDLNCTTCLINISGKNESGDTQIINEVGIEMYAGDGRYASTPTDTGTIAIATTSTYSLMVREVLDEPLTVLNGSVFNITLKLNF